MRCRYKRLSDQCYLKHCRDHGFPLPRGCAPQAADAAESESPRADEACVQPQLLLLAAQDSAMDGQSDVIKEGDHLSATMDEATVEREFWHTVAYM